MGDKYLSEVIDLERDILPYQVVEIYAGVGAGKNTWVEKLATLKDKNGKAYNILFVTSRRATANMQAQKMGAAGWLNLSELDRTAIGKGRQTKLVCTNSGIEQFAKKQFSKDKATHIWDYLDFIILDEGHSLVADATFSDAPFYVEKFIETSVQRNPNCHLIIMTGTPEPISWLVENGFPETVSKNKLDLLEVCKCVEPKEIYIETKAGIEPEIYDHWKKGNKLIYFFSSIERMKTMVDWLHTKDNTIIDSIAVTFSDDEKEARFQEYPSLKSKRPEIQEKIELDGVLPEDVSLFFTTTKNKEGININNQDVKVMYAESCQRTELVQMAGRVRNGLDSLHVVYDAPWYFTQDAKLEMLIDKYCFPMVVEAEANYRGYKGWINENHEKAKDSIYYEREYWIVPLSDEKVIEKIEKRFSSIKYNRFNDKWELYTGRHKGFEQLERDTIDLNNWIGCWSQNLAEAMGASNGSYGEKSFREWFPHSIVFAPSIPNPSFSVLETIKTEFKQWLESAGYLNRKITDKDRNTVSEKLKKILQNYGKEELSKANIKSDFKSLEPALNKLGYTIERKGKHGSETQGYQITEIKQK